MEFTEAFTEKIPVQLENGKVIKIEVSQTGQEDVGFDDEPLSFKEVTDALEGIVNSLNNTIQKVNPDKASVKFGMKLAVEAGQLTAMIVKGSSKANLEITLEWSK